MKKRFAMSMGMLLLSLTVGCQTTPSSQTIKQQNEDYMLNAVESERQSYIVPQSIEESQDLTDKLSLMFNAAVIVPQPVACAVQEVVALNFSDEKIMQLIEYFNPNYELILKPETTKAEIMQEIADIQNDYGTNALDDITTEYMAYLEKQLENAPLEYCPVPFALDNVEGNSFFSAYALHDDGTLSRFSGKRNGSSFCYVRDSNLSLYRKDILLPNEDRELLKHFEGEFPITENEARKIALYVVEELGLTDLKLLSSEKICSFDRSEIESKGWDFIFTRDNSGLQSYFAFDTITFGGKDVPMPTHCCPWEQEVLLLSIDQDGVLCFDLRNYTKFTNVLFKNVEILPWDEIQQSIEKQLYYQHAYSSSKCDKTSIMVEEIILRSATINVINEMNVGRAVPVWHVKYRVVASLGTNTWSYMDSLFINAIDGSYVEPRISYTTWAEEVLESKQ